MNLLGAIAGGIARLAGTVTSALMVTNQTRSFT